MQHWLAFPWVRYTLWLIAGILLAFLYPSESQWLVWYCCFVASCYLGAVVVLKKNYAKYQLVWGLLAFSLIFSFAYLRTETVLQVRLPAERQASYWWVEVAQEPVKTAKSFRFTSLVTAAGSQEEAIRAMVYLPIRKMDSMPQPGQLLLVKARLNKTAAPLNPHEFDYSAYLASLGIHYQLFAAAVVAVPRQQDALGAISALGYQSKQYLLAQIDRFIAQPQARAVVRAMVLGERSGLDRNLQQAYADAGVMHVLAVSGLHVGMVYMLVLLLFPYFQRQAWQRMLWLVLSLLVLWSYAWLTGLAPSTLRAAVMFSMIAIGKTMRRSGNVYNSIAFSAFLLLLWNPQLIRQVGFQLSYLAVIGIVYLQPRIGSWYQPHSAWKRKIWEMSSVTLAAQLATFPLGLFYFQQFPTYFFVGNFLAVPLSFLILYGTLFLLAVHWIPFINLLVAWLLNWLTVGLNAWVQFTEQLPSSRLLAAVSTLDVLLIYAAMLAFLLLVRLRSYGWALCFCSLMLLIALNGIWRTFQLRTQRAVTVYHIPGHTLVQFVWAKRDALLTFGESPSLQQLQYHVEPARIQAGLQPLIDRARLPQEFNVPQRSLNGVQLLMWQGLRMAVISGKEQAVLPNTAIPVDVLLLRKDPEHSLERLQRVFPSKLLIMDASNSPWYRKKIKIKAKSLALPCHITSENGAYHQQL